MHKRVSVSSILRAALLVAASVESSAGATDLRQQAIPNGGKAFSVLSPFSSVNQAEGADACPDWIAFPFVISFDRLPRWDWKGSFRHEEEAKLIAAEYRHHFVATTLFLIYDKDDVKSLGEVTRGARVDREMREHFPGSIDERRRALNEAERRLALLLAIEGQHLQTRPEVPRQRNPEGVLRPAGLGGVELRVEFKTLEPTSDAERLFRVIRDSLAEGGQAPFVIVDATATTISGAELVQIVFRLVRWLSTKWEKGYPDRLHELRVLTADADRTFVLYPLPHLFGHSVPDLRVNKPTGD